MTGILCMVGGSGGSSPLLDTQTVTRGQTTIGTNPVEVYSGFDTALSLGSISDGTSNIYGGASILGLFFYEKGYTSPPVGYTEANVVWAVNGTQPNSGWTTMTVGTTAFNRVDATFYVTAGASNWLWTLSIPDPYVGAADPFSASTTVQWT